ncbi:MAG TPA: NADP-dependent phosphogluconate dehydrogenase, partial [Methylococcaceae bacterium]|nr:NADP-dependent phosphogluconate dehydrogenase [Methylococcaceae bacterium]
MKANIGLFGLAVMGQNLVLNMHDNGFKVAVYNHTRDLTDAFMDGAAKGTEIMPAYSLETFVNSIEAPRKVMLMVKAGEVVDQCI